MNPKPTEFQDLRESQRYKVDTIKIYVYGFWNSSIEYFIINL